MDLQALKAELTNDPLVRGYAEMDDVEAARSLNTPNRQPDAETISPGDLVASIVRSEYDSLAAAGKTYLGMVVSCASSIPLTATLKSQLGALFGAGTTTRANFQALTKRTGSRAEELGLGRVTESDVANAKRS